MAKKTTRKKTAKKKSTAARSTASMLKKKQSKKKTAKKTTKKKNIKKKVTKKKTTRKKTTKKKAVKKINNKTQKTTASVSKFLDSIKNPNQKKDCKVILKIIKDVTKKKPTMWGKSLIGFDTYQYTNSQGKVGEFFRIGFSPRINQTTIYIMPGYQDFGPLLKKLGPHKLGKCCLYLKSLENIHLPTLKKIITKGYKDMKAKGNLDYRKVKRKKKK